jgi:branched-chain amino acid transport system permease protein
LLVLPLLLQQGGINAWVRLLTWRCCMRLLALAQHRITLVCSDLLRFCRVCHLFVLLDRRIWPRLFHGCNFRTACTDLGHHTDGGCIAAAFFGILLGPLVQAARRLPAIVTLGFGELQNNLDRPINLTNGPKGINQIDLDQVLRLRLRQVTTFFGIEFARCRCITISVLVIVFSHRLHRLQKSRIGRA